MTALPYKTFTELLADLERYDTTKQLAEKLKEWLTELHRTPDEVTRFSLCSKNGMDILEFDEKQWLCEQHYPKYDVAVTFTDKTKKRTWFVIREDRADLWKDLSKAVSI
jgi:hypothetical protein